MCVCFMCHCTQEHDDSVAPQIKGKYCCNQQWMCLLLSSCTKSIFYTIPKEQWVKPAALTVSLSGDHVDLRFNYKIIEEMCECVCNCACMDAWMHV